MAAAPSPNLYGREFVIGPLSDKYGPREALVEQLEQHNGVSVAPDAVDWPADASARRSHGPSLFVDETLVAAGDAVTRALAARYLTANPRGRVVSVRWLVKSFEAGARCSQVPLALPRHALLEELPHFPDPFLKDPAWGVPSEHEHLYEPRTVIDKEVDAIMRAIMGKDRWWVKVGDPVITAKWGEEIAQQSCRFLPDSLTRALAELRWLVSNGVDVESGIVPSAIRYVWLSDALVPADVRDELLRGLARVSEAQPEVDYHPGSAEQVIDVIHPSLFCAHYGFSFVSSEPLAFPPVGASAFPSGIDESKLARLAPPGEEAKRGPDLSQKFHWLPADVAVGEDGQYAFLSYINNVHPVRHADLYATLERILTRFVPLFERALSHLFVILNSREQALAGGLYDESKKPEFDDDDYDAWDEWESSKPLNPLLVEPLDEEPLQTLRDVSLRGKRLQIIVKAATIALEPGTSYAGGSWHVEGMENERIIATGIYYAESTNIDDSRLAFRRAISDPEYEQNDNRGVKYEYGLEDGATMNEALGSLECVEGRCAVFPNLFQHRVEPFGLRDPSLPGTRREVPSSRFVLPQQLDWFAEAVDDVLDEHIPVRDLRAIALEYVNRSALGLKTLEEAKETRLALMHERKYAVDAHTEEVFEREFSLCEH